MGCHLETGQGLFNSDLFKERKTKPGSFAWIKGIREFFIIPGTSRSLSFRLTDFVKLVVARMFYGRPDFVSHNRKFRNAAHQTDTSYANSSTIVDYLGEELQESESVAALAFFYFAFDGEKIQTVNTLMRSLIFQLHAQNSKLYHHLVDFYETCRRGGSGHRQPRNEELEKHSCRCCQKCRACICYSTQLMKP
jgi:hypothetical protein